MPRPWRTVSSRVVHERRPWLVLREEHVVLPNGVEIPDYIVAEEPSVAMIFAVTVDGHVPLVTQYRHGARQATLDLPAGYIDGDEPPLAAAQRELAEETGYTGGAWTHLGSLWRNSSRGAQQLHLFLAEGVRPDGERHLDDTEELEVSLVPLDDITEFVTSGRITGMSSAAGILWARLRLSSKPL